jgi:hypothetical protein
MNPSITLSVISALLVACVLALLFSSAFVQLDLAVTVSALPITAIFGLFLAIESFLAEIRIATATLRVAHAPH